METLPCATFVNFSLFPAPRGVGVERGVENRERARFFAGYPITCKKSERFSERNFFAGEISRPREALTPAKKVHPILRCKRRRDDPLGANVHQQMKTLPCGLSRKFCDGIFYHPKPALEKSLITTQTIKIVDEQN